MYTTALQEIISFLFGRRYYANIVLWRGTLKYSICEYIFGSKYEAKQHADSLIDNDTFAYIETISFRTRNEITVTSYTPPTDE